MERIQSFFFLFFSNSSCTSVLRIFKNQVIIRYLSLSQAKKNINARGKKFLHIMSTINIRPPRQINMIETLEALRAQLNKGDDDDLDQHYSLTPADDKGRFEEIFDDNHIDDGEHSSNKSHTDGVSDNKQGEHSKDPDQHDDQLTIAQVENSEDSKKAAFEFLALPYEIRHIIYQLLLRTYRTIYPTDEWQYRFEFLPDGKRHDLHPNILGTCRQIHSEGRDVLYGENLFSVSAWELHDTCNIRTQRNLWEYSDPHYMRIQCNSYLSQMREIGALQFRSMKRIELVVDEFLCRSGIADAVRTTGRVLSQLGELKHLSIKFQGERETQISVLKGLEMIRNVAEVNVEGVPTKCAQHLIKKLTTSSPIPRMYFALEFYASSIERTQDALHRAYLAATRDDPDGFLSAREEVIKAVLDHMNHATDHLLDYDPIQEETQKCTRSSGCQHCLPTISAHGKHDLMEG